VSTSLADIVNKASQLIGTTYSGRNYHAIQHLVRSIDVVLTLYHKSEVLEDGKVEELRAFFEFGWAPLLKKYYEQIDVSIYEPFPLMDDKSIDWAYSNINYSGKIEFCKQLLAYEKAGLIKISNPKVNEFTFSYLNETIGIERFDILSHDFYKEKIVEQFINQKKSKHPANEKTILAELRKIIKNPTGKLISYETTPEIDEYYDREGHYYVLRLQGYDDFDTTDKFGSIEYWKYVDIIELVVGVALKHLAACIELKKMNNNVDFHNLLTYTYFKEKTINDFASYINGKSEEVKQIFSCITLDKDNFDYYLEYPATPPPMYFQVSENILIRSIAGCLSNPFALLNRELKRKFKKDYDIAVNNREDRFRKELFVFFPQDRVIKIPRAINISFEGVKTDIDAVVYDSFTGTLGLFQLKWQDPFAKSMTERFSRMSNLFPKANEWISKLRFWVSNNSAKTIINSLQIDKCFTGNTPINEVFVFVISRNTMNFTGVEMDNSVAWSTWYQLIESQARVKSISDNPIKEMFMKIKTLSPVHRLKTEGLPKVEDIEVKLGETTIYYKN
jgi:hypothetical protein